MRDTAAEAGPSRQVGSLLGPGWLEVQSFEDVEDLDEYEDEEEESYVVLDLGTAVDGRTLLTEGSYQLIGMDTATPFIQVGDHILRGEIASLIGDEVILGLQRSHADVSPPSHPPMYKTSQRVTFRPVMLTERQKGDVDMDGGHLDSLSGGLNPSSRARLFPLNAEPGPSAPRSRVDPRLHELSTASQQPRRRSAPRSAIAVDDEMPEDPLVELSKAPGPAGAVPKARRQGQGKPTGRPRNPDRHVMVTSAAELSMLDLPNLRKDIRIEIQSPESEDSEVNLLPRAPVPLLKYADIADFAALEQALRNGARVSLTRRQVELLLGTRSNAAAGGSTGPPEPGSSIVEEGPKDEAVPGADAMEVDPAGGVHVSGPTTSDHAAPPKPPQPRRKAQRVAGEALLNAAVPRRPR